MAEPAQNLPANDGPESADTPATREIRWDPFESLRSEMDRMFEDFFPMSWNRQRSQRSPAESFPRFEPRSIAPAMEMVETDSGYQITAELPGMDVSDVELTVSHGVLTIGGEKKEEKSDRKSGYVMSERRYGSFRRSFRLPDDVDQDAVSADFRNGVLTLSLPRSETVKAQERQIEIKNG